MEFYEKERFDTIEAIRKAFESNNIPEIVSVYRYGPFVKDNKLNLVHNVVVFVKTIQEKTDFEFITKLRDFRKKIDLKGTEASISNFMTIMSLEEIESPDFLKSKKYFWFLDFLLNHYCIFGKKLEPEFLELFKKIEYDVAKEEVTLYFSNPHTYLPEWFSLVTVDDSTDHILDFIYFNISRYILLLERENNLELIEDLSKKSRKQLYDYANDLINKAKNLDFKKIYEENKKLEIATGNAAGCVLYNPKLKKILILEKDYSRKFWEIPKGGIIPGETMEDTIRRELIEETGITEVIINKDIKLPQVDYGYKHINKPHLFRKINVKYYFCETKETEIKLSSEHTNYKWIYPEEIDKYNLHLPAKYVVYCSNQNKEKNKFSFKNIFK